MARPDVVQIKEQPKPIFYIDADGKRRKHTFDFLVTRITGEKVAISVKPSKRAEKQNLKETLALIASQLTRKVADRVLLMTELSMDRTMEFNAFAFDAARRCPSNDDDDSLIHKLVIGIGRPTTIREIIRLSGLGGRAFWPVVRLIENGILNLVHHVKLTGRALVQVAKQFIGGLP